MKLYTIVLGIFMALGVQPMLAQNLEHRETIRKTLEMEPGTSQLEVWNLNGSVSVTGYDGSEIRIEVEKVIRAENQDQLETGKGEIGFEAISEILLTTIMGTTVIHELIGPVAAKYSLVKAGEVNSS